jgi:hypothetical protein
LIGGCRFTSETEPLFVFKHIKYYRKKNKKIFCAKLARMDSATVSLCYQKQFSLRVNFKKNGIQNNFTARRTLRFMFRCSAFKMLKQMIAEGKA